VPVVVQGLRELNRAFANTDREIRLGWKADQRQIAEPIRQDAEQKAMSSIRRMPASPKWARMRTGVTRTMVYVAPRQRGARTAGRRQMRRPNLFDLLLERALIPAGEAHEHQTDIEVERLMDKVAAGFNHG
jgi:hypothetical protein